MIIGNQWGTAQMLFALFFFIQSATDLCAQLQNRQWHFGEQVSLIIDQDSVIEYFQSEIHAFEACASICDEFGDILIYASDTLVYNGSDLVLVNGTGLLGHFSSTQGSLIVPKPEDPSLYYLFQRGGFLDPRVYYNVIDITGGGSVIQKNLPLYFPVTEKLTAVLHSNEQDYWLLMKEMPGNAFLAFHLSANGLDTIPVVSQSGTEILWSSQQAAGYLRADRSGEKIAYCIANKNLLEICDFNSQTGVVSNCVTLDTVPGAYGVEFSYNGSKLYCTGNGIIVGDPIFVYQYDLLAGSVSAIRSSRFLVATSILQAGGTEAFGTIALAPDRKIYLARPWTDQLGVISSPDSAGAACNYLENGFQLTNGQCMTGLPNQIKKYADVVDAVIEEGPIPEFAIYPNPAWEGFHVQLPSALYKKYLNFELFDLTGRVVNMGELTNKERYSISREDLEAGLYQGVVRDEQKVVGVFRVIFE